MRKQIPGACCNVVYTSGTTGNPKGVMISHDNMTWASTALYEELKEKLELSDDERSISYLPMSHIAS
jgi:long-chain-fatty-acid--CoA ligase ACSBG